jgi:4-diphosphocytidyl-2-C-methyl-D-erythritol kinase
VVEPLQLGRPLDLVLASPAVGLSTARVFGQLIVPAEPRDGSAVRRAAEEGRVEDLGRLLHNCLQEPAEALCPEVGELRRRVEALAPAGALMSGSGSTVFALCRGPAEALRIARALKAGTESGPGLHVRVVRSCD